MSPTNPPTQAPTVAELLANPVVQAAPDQAWNVSQPAAPPNVRHEEGGWIYLDTTSGQIDIRRASRGAGDNIDLGNPPHVVGSVVVGTFHTHPNPSSEGWETMPSPDDE